MSTALRALEIVDITGNEAKYTNQRRRASLPFPIRQESSSLLATEHTPVSSNNRDACQHSRDVFSQAHIQTYLAKKAEPEHVRQHAARVCFTERQRFGRDSGTQAPGVPENPVR